MSEKTLQTILVGVVVLIVAYGAVALLRSSPGDRGGGEADALTEFLGGLDPGRVEEALLVDGEDTVRLARSDDGGWSVNGHRADSARVAGLWTSLTGSEPGAAVARNPENHARLGVDEDAATRVVLRMEDGSTRELLVGESGPPYPSAYVRLGGEDEVHLLEGGLAASARQSATTWRDRSVARVDTSSVRVVESASPSGSYTLERADDGSWTVDGAAADRAQVRNLVGGLARVVASDFVEPEADGSAGGDESAAEDPGPADAGTRRLVALDEGGDTLAALTFRGSEASGYTVRSRGDSTVYEIATFDVARLFPGLDALTLEEESGEER